MLVWGQLAMIVCGDWEGWDRGFSLKLSLGSSISWWLGTIKLSLAEAQLLVKEMISVLCITWICDMIILIMGQIIQLLRIKHTSETSSNREWNCSSLGWALVTWTPLYGLLISYWTPSVVFGLGDLFPQQPLLRQMELCFGNTCKIHYHLLPWVESNEIISY